MATFPFIQVRQMKRSFLLTMLPASLIAKISYASVRRQDVEAGAVQRVLNNSRIAGIKAFTLGGGDYPASIVLNWVGGELIRSNNCVDIPDVERSAQIIDGQHRVAGIRSALEENPYLSSLQLPVAIYESLDTIQCANIFLSINTEQRPVPRSLVFDLYGIASEDLVDQAAVRAKDIAEALNGEKKAYEGLIKYPNSPMKKGGVALSTAVSAIKPLVEEKGILDQVGISELELQITVFNNYFSVLASKYGERWPEKENAFIYAAGFMGAIEFLKLKIIPYCVAVGKFSFDVIDRAIVLDSTDLILQAEVKGLGGRDAPRKVFDRLMESFHCVDIPNSNYEF